MRNRSLIVITGFAMALAASCSVTQQPPPTPTPPARSADTTARAAATARTGVRGYSQVITKDAITDSGLFNVHKVADKWYFEVPDSLLRRDLLWITRFAAIPSGLGGGFVNAGSSVNEQMVVWEKVDNRILLRSKSTSNFSADSLPINISVQANNYMPIIYAFDIAAVGRDSQSYVIDVSRFFLSDVKAISGITAAMRRDYKVTRLDETRSFISSMKSFPMNVEIRQDLSYDAAEPPTNAAAGTISVLMNQSMVLLPRVPMQPRINDYRVGYFNVNRIDYGSEAYKADNVSYIRRWRLEPKDVAAYRRGELVEPVKPIVYYLDPATPAKLRPYIKAGVEAWQKVFETAGFKNAILAKDPPTPQEDPDFNPEDVRYSVIRYVASTTRNAVGPSVSDPRSGEIIESDIIWYHNHLRSYRNRYLLETGAANPSARTLNTPIEDLGEMMKYVITHEIGHALGLPHNMKASAAYPTDSLRSASFTNKFGIAATIMDYARFNYVAQPGDKGVRFVRQLGPYDHYVINWGYRYLPDARSAQEEIPTLSKWIEEKSGDPIYRFGSGESFDPESQTENIGDDPIKASTYAIKNLKVVAGKLYDWTAAETNDYEDLSELYGELTSTLSRYIGHVVTNIGGVKNERLKPNQKGNIYTPVPASEQAASMNWLLANAFASPDWLHQAKIVRNIHHANHVDNIRSLQVRHLNSLLSAERLTRLTENDIHNVNYNANTMITQLQSGIWKELASGSKIDIYRRNLQKAYIERMAFLLAEQPATATATRASATPVNVSQSDILSIVRAQLVRLSQQLKAASGKHQNDLTRFHIDDSIARIDRILNPNK
ncbi:zinc-dependent metalloprotease [Aridibaculum aurantiacum]|uniref:zinc-dependent metalloprotease n=1 Tax=Aridibaculum aurantiacum TaxID=2810307 RepID=UPI001A96039A|nr:zinc-dependent metalloprotease [Aridibaculum aurantiacum]